MKDWADDEAERLFDMVLDGDENVVDEIARSLRVAAQRFHSWDENRVIAVAARAVSAWYVSSSNWTQPMLYVGTLKEVEEMCAQATAKSRWFRDTKPEENSRYLVEGPFSV